jgi:SagB-type dehydrogenase family enzyme
MIRPDDPTTLSLLFHLNSEPWLNDEAYHQGAPCPEPATLVAGPASVALPAARPSGLNSLAQRRRSCRDFEVTSLPLSTVADLLASAYGIVEVVPGAQGARLHRHPVPSAGGLYPLELVAFLRRIDGLTDGIYHFHPVAHSLEVMAEGDLFDSVLAPSLYAYPFIANANGLIAITAIFDRIQRKYGPRGYRYLMLEAGHVAQNLVLRGVELGLGTLCAGGFTDGSLNASLQLDPRRAGVVYSVAFGIAKIVGEALPAHDDSAG